MTSSVFSLPPFPGEKRENRYCLLKLPTIALVFVLVALMVTRVVSRFLGLKLVIKSRPFS
ncbi:hypothetical protein Hanom_Chr07g00652411 [Helianthus anomalus]